MALWMPWGLGTTATLLMALSLMALLCFALDQWVLRLYADPAFHIEAEDSATPGGHATARLFFWVLGLLLGALCAWQMGATVAMLAALVFSAMVLALARLDVQTGLLPDSLTLPLLWLGLLVNLGDTFARLPDAVIGAAAGYLVLWSLYWLFRWRTGRDALGFGDFKFLAALGAWFGWPLLPDLLLASALSALVVAGLRRWRGTLSAGESFSFGPFLALAGLAILLRPAWL